MLQSTKANLYLFIITAIWGLTFPLVRHAIAHINPFHFVCIRFAFAGVILIPWVWKRLKFTNKRVLWASLFLGALNCLYYVAQTLGLETISSGRAAFITGFSVVLVPFLLPLFGLGRPRGLDIFNSLLCLLGIYILTGANLEGVGLGDLEVFIAAALFATAIAFIQYISLTVKEYKLLAFYQILFTSMPLWPFYAKFDTDNLLYPSALLALLFTAIFATSVAFLVQMKYQPQTTAAKAALIFALEPVFACIFGFLLNNEPITGYMVVGGVIILASIAWHDLIKLLKAIIYRDN